MSGSRVVILFVVLVLAMGILAGIGTIDAEPTCPVEHQQLRHGDVEREFLVRDALLGDSVGLTDHLWVAIHENSSVAIGSVVGARTVFVHPENGTLQHDLQSLDGAWRTPRGHVSLHADFRRDEATVTIEEPLYERSIEGPIVKYCGPLG